MDSLFSSSISLFFARFLGIYLFTMGLALILNTERFKNLYLKVINDDQQILLSAILSLFIGAGIIASHNIWIMGWPLIITIIGYWAVIKGFLLIANNKFILFFQPILTLDCTTYRVFGALLSVLGLFLVYQGFLA